MRWQNLEVLLLLWLLPLLVGVYFYAAKARRRALESFVGSDLLKLINPSVSRASRFWKAALVMVSLALIIVAGARPAWDAAPREIERQGRDVVFVVDVSRSMLAEDLKPNRLERAKLAIKDTLDRLQGDRVALVAFAGYAVVKCPLTLDYGFFRMMLDDLSPQSVSRGGTMIGDAIRKTNDEVFEDQDKRFKDIVLITDGEDHESAPVEAAAAAGERGVRLIAIGIGDEEQGQRVPVRDEWGRKSFLKHEGREVWSKLDGGTLRRMVMATPGGRYLNVATGAIDLGDVYLRLVASADKKKLESTTLQVYQEKFQIFLLLALLALVAEMLIKDRRAVTN
ncbi:MAG: VWA domain-containing protein [Deltaproteobacteria bacterium]|nr:VWA domain-containing protein [Deltaproteobacteria bacterium]